MSVLKRAASKVVGNLIRGALVQEEMRVAYSSVITAQPTSNLGATGGRVSFFQVSGSTRTAAYVQTYSTTSRTVPAYTTNSQSVAYTGAADGEAKLVDLNALRAAYENLRASHDALLNVVSQMLDDFQAYGLLR